MVPTPQVLIAVRNDDKIKSITYVYNILSTLQSDKD